MNEEQVWTPTRGILTALRVLGVRLSIGFAVYSLILYAIWPAVRSLPPFYLILGLFGGCGMVMGLVMGLLAARRLVERCGFAGLFLLVIVAACLIGMTLACYYFVIAARGDGGMNGQILGFCMAAGGVFAAARTILLD